MTSERETDWDAPGKPRKPTIIGIGAQKAGTTWLSEMLAQHPKVWTPPVKEVQFFSHRFVPEVREWLPWHFRRSRQNIEKRWQDRQEPMPQGMVDYLDRVMTKPKFNGDWYKNVFAPAPRGSQPMEITPEYATIPDEGVEFMRDFLPRACFICIIRDPVDRAISQIKMRFMREKRCPTDLQPWLDRLDDAALYSRGDYAGYVPRWQRHFDADRLLILPFGQIAADPAALLARIEDFLGLPRHDYEAAHRKVFAAPGDLIVPDMLHDVLRERLQPQYDFLQANFPPEFNSRLR